MPDCAKCGSSVRVVEGCEFYDGDLCWSCVLEENDEYKASFDLRWKADMRAIKMWQKANPGNDLVWPDHADLVVWLAGQLKGKNEN